MNSLFSKTCRSISKLVEEFTKNTVKFFRICMWLASLIKKSTKTTIIQISLCQI